jgi:hypothetical protein
VHYGGERFSTDNKTLPKIVWTFLDFQNEEVYWEIQLRLNSSPPVGIPYLYKKLPSERKKGFLDPLQKETVSFHTIHVDHLGRFKKTNRSSFLLKSGNWRRLGSWSSSCRKSPRLMNHRSALSRTKVLHSVRRNWRFCAAPHNRWRRNTTRYRQGKLKDLFGAGRSRAIRRGVGFSHGLSQISVRGGSDKPVKNINVSHVGPAY